MSNISMQVTADSVAWYGAIIATIGFILSAYNIFRDRSKIKIECSNCLMVNMPGYDNNKKHIDVKVVNMGRRPVLISTACIKKAFQKGFLLLNDSVLNTQNKNKLLTEENPKIDFFVEETEISKNDIYYILIYDATGKKYKKYINFFSPITMIFRLLKNEK